MAGLTGRMSTVVKAKVSKLLDRAEDPAETLDYSYQKQVEQLQNVKKGIADVVTAKKRLQMQESSLQQSVVKLDTQARQAVSAGQEDLARAALERKNVAQTELQSLDTQVTELEDQQQKLTDSEQKLRAKIEAFRTKKEVIKAQYSAAEAQVRISEAATGVGEQMADVGLAMQRAVDKTENMRARADAVQELEAAGTFDDLTALGPQAALEQAGRGRRAREDEGRNRGRRLRTGRPDPVSEQRPRRPADMIVRISGEDQYRLADEDAKTLNELEAAVIAVVDSGSEDGFGDAYGAMLDFVRSHGTPVGDDELEASDHILPPADITFTEAAAEFTGEGLIPD
jgi:phage shock protein A